MNNLNHRERVMEPMLDELTARVDELPSQSVPAGLLQGCPVVRGTGEEVGEVEEIIVDTQTGRVSHVVASCGNWSDTKSIAIPWQSLRYDAARVRFLVKRGEEHWVLS